MRFINVVFICINFLLVYLFMKIEELRERRLCVYLYEYRVLLMFYMNWEWCMFVILILFIFILYIFNCFLKYRLNVSCNIDLFFFVWIICIKCRLFVCWGYWGCMWFCFFLLFSVGFIFDIFCFLLCSNI